MGVPPPLSVSLLWDSVPLCETVTFVEDQNKLWYLSRSDGWMPVEVQFRPLPKITNVSQNTRDGGVLSRTLPDWCCFTNSLLKQKTTIVPLSDRGRVGVCRTSLFLSFLYSVRLPLDDPEWLGWPCCRLLLPRLPRVSFTVLWFVVSSLFLSAGHKRWEIRVGGVHRICRNVGEE